MIIRHLIQGENRNLPRSYVCGLLQFSRVVNLFVYRDKAWRKLSRFFVRKKLNCFLMAYLGSFRTGLQALGIGKHAILPVTVLQGKIVCHCDVK